MHTLVSTTRRLLAALALALPPLAALADPVSFFVPFAGQGNVSVFDAAAGSGGWVGSLDQVPPPDVPAPLSLVSVVLFQFDAATQALIGNFTFTTTDLASTLFGSLTGTADSADFLTTGGQLSLDYAIEGGSGAFAGASGFGISFLNFDTSAGLFDNYSETGLLNFSVPAPGTLALAAAALLAAGLARRGSGGKGGPVKSAG